MADWQILQGDCRERLKDLPDACIDSVVTDPPYELGFMGKKWDATGIAYDVALWREVLRVLKPGGHLLAFGGTRTYHRMACAIEDAGFEVRDSLMWLYATGFPKSLDVSKAIDKDAGHWRGKAGAVLSGNVAMSAGNYERTPKGDPVTAAAWSGWGTALKPAHEPIVLARKPLTGTVAANVLEHGTGALNIDGCRIGDNGGGWGGGGSALFEGGLSRVGGDARPTQGRWPANVLLSEEAAADLDAQSGYSKSPKKVTRGASRSGNSGLGQLGRQEDVPCYDDDGGASRFFYVCKPSRREREAGCELLPAKTGAEVVEREEGSAGVNNPRAGAGRTAKEVRNGHPTVKPIMLMRYLVRLITPPGGVVLDPFCGSGTTGCAAVMEGFDFLGLEREQGYVSIAESRIAHWLNTKEAA